MLELLFMRRRLGFGEHALGSSELVKGQPFRSDSRGGSQVEKKDDRPRDSHQENDAQHNRLIGNREPIEEDVALLCMSAGENAGWVPGKPTSRQPAKSLLPP